MQIDRKDIGYTVYSRLEDALRSWVRAVLLEHGDQWPTRIPRGVWDKSLNRASIGAPEEVNDPADLLEETDIPDVAEIVCYKNAFRSFAPHGVFSQDAFQDRMRCLYELRCKIAHVRKSFNVIDLDQLLGIAEQFLPVLGKHGDDLREILACLKTNPASVVLHIPSDFLFQCDPETSCMNNLPPSDYDPDGGFIGRREDRKKLRNLVLGDLDRVITISGAGGVGKTALAHKFCVELLQSSPMPFDAIIWISAKEEKLILPAVVFDLDRAVPGQIR